MRNSSYSASEKMAAPKNAPKNTVKKSLADSAEASVKPPQRQRGRERVATLLAAAVGVFAEKGYEAATMTEIAARAGASIGSLYQFFPTKELLAAALHEANGQALSQMLDDLASQTAGQSPMAVADRLFDTLSAFLADHPAFVVLIDRRDPDQVAKQARRTKLREQVASLLLGTSPSLPADKAEAMAVIILHFMKIAMVVGSEVDLPDGQSALSELRMMLRNHLQLLATG